MSTVVHTINRKKKGDGLCLIVQVRFSSPPGKLNHKELQGVK